jgi:hypothetical protein
MAIGRGQFTIIDYNDVNISTTEPSTKAVDMLWLDSSVVPNQLKRWNGSKWDIVSDYQIGGRNLLRNTSQPVDGVNLVGGSGSYSSIVSDAIKGNVLERALTTTTEGFLYTSRTGI